jgi:hypothetical protein
VRKQRFVGLDSDEPDALGPSETPGADRTVEVQQLSARVEAAVGELLRVQASHSAHAACQQIALCLATARVAATAFPALPRRASEADQARARPVITF